MGAISVVVILPLLGVKVGLKNWVLYAAKVVAVFSTVMGAKVAPVGTVTLKLVAVAAVTVALVAPKKTTLLTAVVLKLVPVMVTVAPTAALVGVKEVMVGWAVNVVVLVNATRHSSIGIRVCFSAVSFMLGKSYGRNKNLAIMLNKNSVVKLNVRLKKNIPNTTYLVVRYDRNL